MKPKESCAEPQTIGEHIRARRLNLGMTQEEAASVLRVSASTVLHWEKGRTIVAVKAFPAVMRFLEYDPLPAPSTLPGRMLKARQHRGWTMKEAAAALGIDEDTWSVWEAGKTLPWPRLRDRLLQFLDGLFN